MKNSSNKLKLPHFLAVWRSGRISDWESSGTWFESGSLHSPTTCYEVSFIYWLIIAVAKKKNNKNVLLIYNGEKRNIFFFLMSKESLNPKITFLSNKSVSVARIQTDTHESEY